MRTGLHAAGVRGASPGRRRGARGGPCGRLSAGGRAAPEVPDGTPGIAPRPAQELRFLLKIEDARQ